MEFPCSRSQEVCRKIIRPEAGDRIVFTWKGKDSVRCGSCARESACLYAGGRRMGDVVKGRGLRALPLVSDCTSVLDPCSEEEVRTTPHESLMKSD